MAQAQLKKTAGKWSGEDRRLYFLATNMEYATASDIHESMLIPMDALGGQEVLLQLDDRLKNGARIILDSGVYWMATQHAIKNKVSMDVALGLDPEKVDGWHIMLERYIRVCKEYGDRAWGYFEMDQGGAVNKTKTRTMLEDEGLRPMPVYHPINDGWDYFDYLAERYDRICFGNVVQANSTTRLRLVATAWERKRKYPGLWIHLLGLTPNEWLNAYSIDSADSSSWLATLRWARGHASFADSKNFGNININYRYVLGGDAPYEKSNIKAISMAAYGANIQQKNWQQHMNDWKSLGLELEPPL